MEAAALLAILTKDSYAGSQRFITGIRNVSYSEAFRHEPKGFENETSCIIKEIQFEIEPQIAAAALRADDANFVEQWSGHTGD